MSQKENGGIYIERELYQSPAFLDLHNNAKTMLIALLDARERERQSDAKDKKGSKRKRRFINLDRIEMPYVTLQKKYLMNQSGIVRAIDKLLANGFIEIKHPGGLGEHDKARYALINDYLLWRPGIIFRTRERDVQRGYQGKNLGAIKKSRTQNDTLTHTQNDTLPKYSRTQNDTLTKPMFSVISEGD